MNWLKGSRVIVLTHNLKSETLSRSPVCMGTPMKYLSQLAMNGAKVTRNGSIQSLKTIETTMSAAWNSSNRRAQVIDFLRASAWSVYTASSHSLLNFPEKASFTVAAMFCTKGKE